MVARPLLGTGRDDGGLRRQGVELGAFGDCARSLCALPLHVAGVVRRLRVDARLLGVPHAPHQRNLAEWVCGAWRESDMDVRLGVGAWGVARGVALGGSVHAVALSSGAYNRVATLGSECQESAPVVRGDRAGCDRDDLCQCVAHNGELRAGCGGKDGAFRPAHAPRFLARVYPRPLPDSFCRRRASSGFGMVDGSAVA